MNEELRAAHLSSRHGRAERRFSDDDHKRPRLMASEEPDRRFMLGTFSRGSSIYRNRLNPAETWEEGHVSLSNLVLPDTVSAFCTSFVPPDSVDWLDSVLAGVPHFILAVHDTRRKIGDAALALWNNKKGWYSVMAKPTGGFLHAKLLLFRTVTGLRVVVAGSNLYQQQWEMHRDCLWVQDFFKKNAPAVSSLFKTNNANNTFEHTLRSFVQDLTTCRDAFDQRLVTTQLRNIFDGINFAPATARLVISFPRPRDDPNEKGGWKHLAQSVRELRNDSEEDANLYDSDDEDSSSRYVLYAMAGSFGNLKPDYLLQMRSAMNGIEENFPQDTAWDQVKGIRCLWPSLETAITMHFSSFANCMRALPLKHWVTIPEKAQQRIFSDAPPNPPKKALQGWHAPSHAKVLFLQQQSLISNRKSLVYVGSHNFSVAAWGLRGKCPNNVELGVVLLTPDTDDSVEHRLPCHLPADDDHQHGGALGNPYAPASAGQIEHALLTRKNHQVSEDTATGMASLLEDQQSPRSMTEKDDGVIDLCDSD